MIGEAFFLKFNESSHKILDNFNYFLRGKELLHLHPGLNKFSHRHTDILYKNIRVNAVSF